jgi:hypothetical protein
MYCKSCLLPRWWQDEGREQESGHRAISTALALRVILFSLPRGWAAPAGYARAVEGIGG